MERAKKTDSTGSREVECHLLEDDFGKKAVAGLPLKPSDAFILIVWACVGVCVCVRASSVCECVRVFLGTLLHSVYFFSLSRSLTRSPFLSSISAYILSHILSWCSDLSKVSSYFIIFSPCFPLFSLSHSYSHILFSFPFFSPSLSI